MEETTVPSNGPTSECEMNLASGFFLVSKVTKSTSKTVMKVSVTNHDPACSNKEK